MKNILKSTVSSFVLLSAIATFTPSKAMEEERGDRENSSCTPSSYSKHQNLKELIQIPTPFTKKQLTLPVFNVDQMQDDPLNPTPMFPAELTQMFIGFLDTPSLLTAQQVSKLWLALA
ncbi:MAG TPA: hypothetical protein VMW10_03520 [Alphaproteobacteria bacterium]|nr:hypothetical protein [Alphaproteobacteria bacterium]